MSYLLQTFCIHECSPSPIYMAQEPRSQKIIKQKYRGSGVFFVFVFLQEHGVAEEVTHMLVRGKQKMPTMVDVSHLFLFFSTLDSS